VRTHERARAHAPRTLQVQLAERRQLQLASCADGDLDAGVGLVEQREAALEQRHVLRPRGLLAQGWRCPDTSPG
jgi:hypothetical protein